MGNYFCGWYFRQQSENQTLALIPSIHQSRESSFCAIQLITDQGAFYTRFPSTAFHKDSSGVRIAGSFFCRDGITLDLQTDDLHASGSLRFGPFTSIGRDIMGPFQYVPFMQCRHSIYSMHHSVDGEITVNGTAFHFQDGNGYAEGDRGSAFPEKYIWTVCSSRDCRAMLSVADIPLCGFHFTGIIGIVHHCGRQYRLATYLGAKAVKISRETICIKQGSLCLTISPGELSGHPLRAPRNGSMKRTIHESPACQVTCRFTVGGKEILNQHFPNAAFEYEY